MRRTRAQIEVDWVRTAVGVGPKELEDPADADPVPARSGRPRTRRRRTRPQTRRVDRQAGPRRDDARSPANLTPEAWAIWEPIFAKYAAPGMCNPADEQPCTSGTPTQAQIDNDHRTLAQRQHDALVAVGRIALMSGELGQLNGLPVSIIIRTTLQDLESRAGVGVTGGGTMMPISDVIRLGGHANHHLAVFDKATGSALDLFRARRVASPAQRIMLIARDGGCTKPGCTVGAYGSQVHHAAARLGRRRQHQRRRTRPGLRARQPHGRPRRLDHPRSTPATKSNGSRRQTWTPAKPGSTTTTDPNGYSDHPTTTPPNPMTPQPNPADPHHPTTKPRSGRLTRAD